MSAHPSRSHVAILLCAGYGTRMGELTHRTPKPLLEVAGRPQLDYLLDQVRELEGIDEVHVVSNSHYHDAFARWAENHEGVRLRVHDDGTTSNEDRLGAIGDLGFVLGRIGSAAVDSAGVDSSAELAGALVCAGDNILRFRLAPFWRGFLARGETTVLALHEPDRQRLKRTGVLEIEQTCGPCRKGAPRTAPRTAELPPSPALRVKRLHEKPENPPSTWACPSFYALDAPSLARVPAYLEEGHPADEIGRLVADLAPRRPVWAHPTQGQRLHVGRPDELERADALLRSEPVITTDGTALDGTALDGTALPPDP